MNFNKYRDFGDYHWKAWRDKSTQYSKHADFCSRWVKERPCLDVGCGDGLIAHLLGREVDGIDDNELAISLALSHGINARQFDVYLIEPFARYNAVFMGDIIEHLDDPGRALRAVRATLFPRGALYISTPPKGKQLHDRYHIREYTPDELVALVEMNGFKIADQVIVRLEWVQMYGKFYRTE